MPRGNSESVNSNPGQLWSEGLTFPSRAELLGQIPEELKSRVLPLGTREPGHVVGAVYRPAVLSWPPNQSTHFPTQLSCSYKGILTIY